MLLGERVIGEERAERRARRDNRRRGHGTPDVRGAELLGRARCRRAGRVRVAGRLRRVVGHAEPDGWRRVLLPPAGHPSRRRSRIRESVRLAADAPHHPDRAAPAALHDRARDRLVVRRVGLLRAEGHLVSDRRGCGRRDRSRRPARRRARVPVSSRRCSPRPIRTSGSSTDSSCRRACSHSRSASRSSRRIASTIDRRSPTRCWVGFAIALAALTRGEGIFLVVILGVPLVIVSGRLTVGRRVALFAAIVVATATLIAPWFIRNVTSFERPVYTSTGADDLVETANCDQTYNGGFLGFWYFQCATDVRGDESVRAEVRRERGIRYMREHKGELPKVFAARVGRIWEVYRPLQNARLRDDRGPTAVGGSGRAGRLLDPRAARRHRWGRDATAAA